MRILMVSWEYPPVVIGGLGRHVYHLSTALAAAGHEVVVLSRRPTNTDPSTHPSLDEINENVRVVAAAQRSARVRLRHRHDGLDAGDGPRDGPRRTLTQATAQRRPVAARCGPRARLAGRPPGHRARGVLTTCQWFPLSTRPRPVGIPAGSPERSVGRCTRSSRGWCANPTR